MTSAPSHPALGLPEGKLRELASVDFHAGAGTTCQRGSTWCPCEGSDVVGDFAVRFITGQAQLSTDTAGRPAHVLALNPDPNPPRMVEFGDTIDAAVLAGLVVYGTVTREPCTDQDCRRRDAHTAPMSQVSGFVVLGHREASDDAVLDLVTEYTSWLTTQRPSTNPDTEPDAGGQRP